ncbi:c-type cytochrome [Chloroflexota bacterium]
MKKHEQKEYMEKYKKEKEKGVPFFPNIIFKDVIVSLIVLIILIGLAYFIGVPVEERANPNDANYTPRPEWYFLFLFQLLKYFPGKLEVVGAMILPGIFVVLLLLLPLLDKSSKRHFRQRPFASITAILVIIGVVGLTMLALNEAPPPVEKVVVDKAADLYSRNCANCHGPIMDVEPGTDLHKVIASGTHEGMPSWGGDLSTDEIDLLAGFILSPNGSALFTQYCSACHNSTLQAIGDPIELSKVFSEGLDYPLHSGVEIPAWKETLTSIEIESLLNFLAAPDGQRLFVINCSGCHGQGIAFNGTDAELEQLIIASDHELAMPGWKGTLSNSELETLALYVTDPHPDSEGSILFDRYCFACHGDNVPVAPDIASAMVMIGSGGSHITMPKWEEILTQDQIDALVRFTLESGDQTGIFAGGIIYSDNCTSCHGQFGQGGLNPAKAGDIIPPISSSEYLKTRNDATIRNIIIQGQPDFGMAPFGSAYGGLLDDDQITALVAFIRNWEDNPPVIPPSTPTPEPTGSDPLPGGEISYSIHVAPILEARCYACHHSPDGQGGYDISTSQLTISSGESGPWIIPGDADNSKLIGLLRAVTGFKMPPLGDPLTDAEIQIIIDWINAGALDN